MSELSTITRHALTVLAGQLAVMAFGVTDTIVAGRHSQESLAALSIAASVLPVAAEAQTSQRQRERGVAERVE